MVDFFIPNYLDEMKDRLDDIQSYAKSMVTENQQSARQDLMSYICQSLDAIDELIANIYSEVE